MCDDTGCCDFTIDGYGQGGEAAVGAGGVGGLDGAQAQAQGLALTGPDGLFKQLTNLEAALNAEMIDHLGHEKHRAEPGRASTNVWNGARSKRVVSEVVGEVEIAVPRDRDSNFEPVIVKAAASAGQRG